MKYKFNQYSDNLNNRPVKSSEDEDDDDSYNKGSGLYYRRRAVHDFDYYLDDYISAPSNYRDLFHCLGNMQEQDSLNIHVNSGGGRIDTTLQLIGLIKECKGEVIITCEGMAASAASILILQCPNILITPDSTMMIHNISFGNYGKEGEVIASVDFTKKQVDKLIHTTYDGFLTENEIKELKIGRDFYFDVDEIVERMKWKIDFIDKRDKVLEKTNKKKKVSKN